MLDANFSHHSFFYGQIYIKYKHIIFPVLFIPKAKTTSPEIPWNRSTIFLNKTKKNRGHLGSNQGPLNLQSNGRIILYAILQNSVYVYFRKMPSILWESFDGLPTPCFVNVCIQRTNLLLPLSSSHTNETKLYVSF